MHNLTVNDALLDTFNPQLVQIDNKEYSRIWNNFSTIRSNLETKQRAANVAAGNPNKYVYVNSGDVLSQQTLLTEAHYISMLFNVNSFLLISGALQGNNNSRYMDWQLLENISSWLVSKPELAKKAIFSKTTSDDIKARIVSRNLINIEFLFESVKNRMILSLPLNMQSHALELCDPSDASIFLDSDYDKVRLAAYIKLGPVSNVDKMIKDPHAPVRRYAINILSAGDARLASFINDRSADIFCQALQKIDAALIPMMLGSTHLKKKRAKDILNNRLLGASS
jgi:hypothetical protein